MSKRVTKSTERKAAKKQQKIGKEDSSLDKISVVENDKKKKVKVYDKEKDSSNNNNNNNKMTLCTQSASENINNNRSLTTRRPGRPPSGKKLMINNNNNNNNNREIMPGKLRSTLYNRRSIDPCDNSNDSGLGFDHQHHTEMSINERLTWTGDRAEAKRPRIKVENEEINDNYCFPNTVLQSKDNISLIHTNNNNNNNGSPTSSSVPSSLNISNNSSTSSSGGRNGSTTTSRRPLAPSATSVPLITSLNSTSRFSDAALTIIRQPEQQHRARYQTEGSRGAVKDRDGNGFPVVQLTGYHKSAILQVYIGTDVGKVSPHMFYQACKVSGKNSTPCIEKKIDGTCVIELALEPTKEMCGTCDCVGILKERNVDVEHRFPDQLGNRSKKKSTRCRMIFRTTLTHDNGTTEILQVCSQPIVCTQPPGIPEICKKSLVSCPASGGLELFVLGKNFLKDTKVYFQQYEEDGQVCWEQAVIPDKEYLQQTHFVCVVPPYRLHSITEPIQVRLCVISSGKTSESHHFVYTPINGTVSVHTDIHAEHAHHHHHQQTFKGALWNSSSSASNFTHHHKQHQQDLDMMPPPDSNLVPLSSTSSRRSSITLTSINGVGGGGGVHSPLMKQEYLDENSQGSENPSERRYRPLSESSLDVNHGDSNLSMINENSVDLLHHHHHHHHHQDSSNLSVVDDDDSVDLIDACDNAVMMNDDDDDENSCILQQNGADADAIVVNEKVMDLRMKLPMNENVTDYISTPSSMVETLKRFGIEHTNGPLPSQTAQSVENYLTKIETPTVFLTSQQQQQQPFLPDTTTISTIAKSEAAAIAEQVITGSMTISNANTTLTTALEGSIISTPINNNNNNNNNTPLSSGNNKLDELLTLESHHHHHHHQLENNTTLLSSENSVPIVVTDGLISPSDIPSLTSNSSQSSILHPQLDVADSLTSESAILNGQLSPASIICRNSPSLQSESLMSMCTSTTDSTLTQTSLLPHSGVGNVSAANSTDAVGGLLSSDPEKAVIFEAAVDFLKTQKKISELVTTTAPDCIGSSSSSSSSSPIINNVIENNFIPFTTINNNNNNNNNNKSSSSSCTIINNSEPINNLSTSSASSGADHNIINNEKIILKNNDDRMIPRGFTALSENELINFINPTCFDQGNNFIIRR